MRVADLLVPFHLGLPLIPLGRFHDASPKGGDYPHAPTRDQRLGRHVITAMRCRSFARNER